MPPEHIVRKLHRNRLTRNTWHSFRNKLNSQSLSSQIQIHRPRIAAEEAPHRRIVFQRAQVVLRGHESNQCSAHKKRTRFTSPRAFGKIPELSYPFGGSTQLGASSIADQRFDQRRVLGEPGRATPQPAPALHHQHVATGRRPCAEPVAGAHHARDAAQTNFPPTEWANTAPLSVQKNRPQRMPCTLSENRRDRSQNRGSTRYERRSGRDSDRCQTHRPAILA